MILGYVVKFYPENLVGIDQPIQSADSREFTSLFDSLLYPSNSADEHTRCCILGWRHRSLLVWKMVYGGPPPHREFSYNWITRGNP